MKSKRVIQLIYNDDFYPYCKETIIKNDAKLVLYRIPPIEFRLTKSKLNPSPSPTGHLDFIEWNPDKAEITFCNSNYKLQCQNNHYVCILAARGRNVAESRYSFHLVINADKTLEIMEKDDYELLYNV